MTDERLRDLERRSRAGGALNDQARLLLQRVRTGELTGDALDLAAALGHPAGCAALGREPADLRGLCATLAARDDLRAGAALALAELALPAWTYPAPPDQVEPGDPVRAAVTSLRAARSRPGAGAEAVGRDAAEAIAWEMDSGHAGGWLRALAATIVRHAAEALAAEHGRYHLRKAADLSLNLFGETRLGHVLRAALLPPLLRPTTAPGPPPEWVDETALIGRRLASGVVTRERVMLAHALGHAPASEALGLAASPGADGERWLEAVAGLGAVGAEAGVRSVVAIAAGELARDDDTAAGRALRTAEAWLVEPTEARARTAAEAAREAALAPGSYRLTPERHLRTALNVETAVPAAAPELAALAARAAARAGLEGLAPVDELREALDTGAARDVNTMADVLREVAPWALGYFDAVRDRVEQERGGA